MEQKHIYKIESLVVLQSIVNGLTRVQTVNRTFCKREYNHLMTRDCLSRHEVKKDVIFSKKKLLSPPSYFLNGTMTDLILTCTVRIPPTK